MLTRRELISIPLGALCKADGVDEATLEELNQAYIQCLLGTDLPDVAFIPGGVVTLQSYLSKRWMFEVETRVTEGWYEDSD